MSTRRGFGRCKHISSSFLWIQQRVKYKELIVYKCDTAETVADVGTKHLASSGVDKHMAACGLIFSAELSHQALKT
eukprot:10402365-Heterocapsa_arctica.AAC.1